MYDSSNRSNPNAQRVGADNQLTELEQTRLVSRRMVLGGFAALGGLSCLPRVARAGSINLGTAPQMLGYMNPTLVHNAFETLTNLHTGKIVSANLTTREWQLLAWRYSGNLSSMLPSSTARSKYAYAKFELPFIPPNLGATGALDSTITEIFLDFRLYGGPLYSPLSLPAASLCTGVFVSGLLGTSLWAGYKAGSYIANWMQRYAPDEWSLVVDDAGYLIGGLNVLQGYAAAANNYLFGQTVWNLDTVVFGVPGYQLNDGTGGFGGWGVLDSATSFFENDGTCFNPGEC